MSRHWPVPPPNGLAQAFWIVQPVRVAEPHPISFQDCISAQPMGQELEQSSNTCPTQKASKITQKLFEPMTLLADTTLSKEL